MVRVKFRDRVMVRVRVRVMSKVLHFSPTTENCWNHQGNLLDQTTINVFLVEVLKSHTDTNQWQVNKMTETS